MKNKTAEEVYVEMLKPAETVTLKVQHRLDDFNVIKDVPGDGFYIRYVHTSLPVKLNYFSECFLVKIAVKRPVFFHCSFISPSHYI